MATYEDFLEMETVEWCVPEAKQKETEAYCSTCDIHNCVRSFGYRASLSFWKERMEQEKLTSFANKLSKDKPIPSIFRADLVVPKGAKK